MKEVDTMLNNYDPRKADILITREDLSRIRDRLTLLRLKWTARL